MSGRGWVARVLIAILFCAASHPATSEAEQRWRVVGGMTTVGLDADPLERLGLRIAPAGPSALGSSSPFQFNLEVDPDSTLTFGFESGSVTGLLDGAIHHVGEMRIGSGRGQRVFRVPTLSNAVADSLAGTLRLDDLNGGGGLLLRRHKVGFNPATRTLTVHSPDLVISDGLANSLGNPMLAGVVVGWVTTRAEAEWIGGDEADVPLAAPRGGAEPRVSGGDMTFCQLFGLVQYGRETDIVGLAMGTTSWNIGDADLMWFAEPGEEHPFIVMNLFRLSNDRIEQIGQSWIKHGFYALGNTQCGTGGCSYEQGHSEGDWLGTGCTDTYSSFLNSLQSGLGPRDEVNPWTGAWTYAGSHLSQSSHSHDGIEHRLQVRDADLDPAQNPGATYYAEGYYVMLDDVNVMNSASWKPVTVSQGVGGVWEFGMSGTSTMPTSGFAIDAWTGATTTLIAQVVPPVEFVSPDGRCILAAKVTDLGGFQWHYEYALLNVDMDRKVSSFTIPIHASTIVTNTGFHAVESHDEPYSNTQWSTVVTSTDITWSTVDNPLRWGTLYNFRFDATAQPLGNATVTLGLYEPGTPTTVSGTTTGPDTGPPDCNNNSIEDSCDLDCGTPGGPCDVPGCGLSLDCQPNGIPDECEPDCQPNGIPDDCDITAMTSLDCQPNGIPDECEADCNQNSIPDDCDIAGLTSQDCNGNGLPDECEIDVNSPAPGGPFFCTSGCDPDCNDNGIPDECDIDLSDPDGNGQISEDCNDNGIPDECEVAVICDNDACDYAMIICPGAYNVSTIGADSDGSASCGTSTNSPDVWFSYTPMTSGTLTVDTCAQGASYDTVLSIHTGCPGTDLNELACDDNSCRTIRSTVTIAVTGGTGYIIRLSGYWGDSGQVTLTVTGPDCDNDALRGGLLWDRWWVVNGQPAPTGDHPLYPTVGQQSGSTTYRCKECHGWDYKGAAGAYGAGSTHYTGIPGVFGSSKTPSEMFEIIKRDDVTNGHGFTNYGLADADIWDLVQFIQDQAVDTDLFIDPNDLFIGDEVQGQTNYTAGTVPNCAACHGADGTVIDFGTPQNPEWIGTIATYNPQEMFHKTRFGQPGMTVMPSWLGAGGNDQGAADLGKYCQTTAFPVDCISNDAECDDGDYCTGVESCQNGRCVTVVLDGDMDLNGKTDGADVDAFVQAVVSASTDPNDLAHGDYSNNSVIDMDDVPCLVMWLLTP